jgi:catechol 2,3-dioxygenase-like lactoylglutathione lyase family enzyme
MVNEIDGLLKQYESGSLSRRQLLARLVGVSTAAALSTTSSSAQERTVLRGRAKMVNHISVYCSDLKRSSAFYEKLGLATPRPIPGALAADFVDPAYVSLRIPSNKADVGKIDHFCIGYDKFDLKRDGDALRAAGVQGEPTKADWGEMFWVHDPDGVSIQLLDAKVVFRK